MRLISCVISAYRICEVFVLTMTLWVHRAQFAEVHNVDSQGPIVVPICYSALMFGFTISVKVCCVS